MSSPSRKPAAGSTHSMRRKTHPAKPRIAPRKVNKSPGGRDHRAQAAEAALRESETRFRLVMEYANDAIVYLDLNGMIQWASLQTTVLTGRPMAELVGSPVMSVLTPGAAVVAEARLAAVRRGEAVPSLVEFEILRPDGQLVVVEANITSVQEAKGVVGRLLVLRDITARKRAENAIRALVTGTASVTGKEFFPVFVRQLAAAVGTRYAFVTELLGGEQARVRVLAIWMGDRLGTPFEYDLLHTPCKMVFNQGRAYHPESVQEIYPKDKDLVALGAVGYLGITLADSSGKPIGHVCVLDDKPLREENAITSLMNVFAARAAAELERKRMEEALRESEAFKNLILESSPDCIKVLDLEGRLLFVSKGGMERLGISDAAPFLNRSWVEFWEGEDKQKARAAIEAARTGGIGRFYGFYPTAAGKSKWWDVLITPMLGLTGKPERLLAISRDITERKQAEQSIREQARLIETFFKNTLACIVLLDRDFNFLRVNETYARACHRDVSDFPGHNHFAFYPSEARKIFEEVRATKVRCQVQARPFVFPDHPEWGVTYWDWTLVPILGESGDVELFVFTLNDVTERKRAEDERRELYVRLQGSHLALRALSRRLMKVQEEERHHIARELHDEIGQALTVAKINIQQAMHALDAPTAGTHLTESVSLLDHTLQQVRSLALDLRPSMLDDLGLVPTLKWLAERHSQTSEIAMQVSAESLDIRPAPEIEIACYRVAQEALTNAARHARASQVRIELARSGRELMLLIRDNGIGFDMTTMLSRAAEGESIGLLGMQERVTLTGGEMEILASPGQGTEIRARFPLDAPGPSRDKHA